MTVVRTVPQDKPYDPARESIGRTSRGRDSATRRFQAREDFLLAHTGKEPAVVNADQAFRAWPYGDTLWQVDGLPGVMLVQRSELETLVRADKLYCANDPDFGQQVQEP